MKKKIKCIILAIGIILIFLLCKIGCTVAVEYKIEQLENTIELNNKIITQIQETKNSLHVAAENLRNVHINDSDLALKLSQKWHDIDKIEKETIKQNNNLKTELQELKQKYLGTFELTAYTYGNITATGTTPTANRTIAVDPKVIPLGSRVYIKGYGIYIAEDTGGVVKGKIIDIYIPGYDNCIKFGRRKAEVYLLD